MKLVKWGKRNPIFQHFHAKKDKETVAAWRLGLDEILQDFNVRPVAWVMAVANLPVPEGTCNQHKYNRFYCSS